MTGTTGCYGKYTKIDYVNSRIINNVHVAQVFNIHRMMSKLHYLIPETSMANVYIKGNQANTHTVYQHTKNMYLTVIVLDVIIIIIIIN